MSLKTNYFYDFAEFRLDTAEKLLLHNGRPVPMTPKVFETLQVLIENAGRLLEKDELMRRIWRDRCVEESNLTFNIKMLRKALGDHAASPRFVETVPRRGYRFIAQVEKTAHAKIATENNEIEETAAEKETEKITAADDFKIKDGLANAADFKVGSNIYVLNNETVRPPENNLTAESSLKSQRFFVSLTIAAALVIGGLTFVSWYAFGKTALAEAPILSEPFSSEKLSTTGKVALAAISPDGKMTAYRTENNHKQSIWLRQLAPVNNVELIAPSEDIYFGLTFSPDAKFLYFTRRERDAEGQADVYRVSVFGGVPTKIISQAQGWISLAPDGSRISFVRCNYTDDEYCALWIADAPDGKNERKLVSRARPIRIGDNRISPDNKFIAFAVGQSENQANEFSLRQINIETGAERELTAHRFFNIKNLTWLPDQNNLLVAASRIPTRNFRIWQVSPDTGDALPLTKDSENYSALSLSDGGDVMAAIQVKSNFDLLLCDSENFVRKKVLTAASTANFAPNGTILFSSSMTGNEEVWSINSDGSGQKQLTNDQADDSEPIPSFDGKTIFFSSNRTGAVHVWRMNADGSNQIQITAREGGFPIFASPDGRWIYYQHGLQRNLWRASVDGAAEELILDKRKYRFAFSPDGLQVAFADNQAAEKKLIVWSLADGQTVKSFFAPIAKSKIHEIEWLSDNSAIALVLADNTNSLWLQPITGKAPHRIADLGDETINSLAFSTNSKDFAIVYGSWNHDAVLLRGLK